MPRLDKNYRINASAKAFQTRRMKATSGGYRKG